MGDRRIMVLGALICYGLLVDPETGRGGLPCLWQLATGSGCFGCGLSRAGALLLRGHPAQAAAMNWLIFPAVALVALEIRKSFFATAREESTHGRTWRR